MNFKYGGYTYDDVFLQKLNESLNDISAFSYNKFLNHKYGNTSIIDVVYLLERNVPYNKAYPKEIGTKCLTLEEQINLVVEFFSIIGFDSVESILNGNNPLYKTNFSQKEKTGGAVSHNNNNEFLEFDIEYNETVHSALILAHEIGHAISNHHIKTAELAKLTNQTERKFGTTSKEFKNQQEIFNKFCDSKLEFNKDCICEIESFISEKLFVLFLVKKGIISQEDFNNFITNQHNNLRHNLMLMIEENEILSRVHNPITEQDCIELFNTFKNTCYLNLLLDRIKIMAERKNHHKSNEQRVHSKHKFRYVVGEVLSSVWFNKYLNASKEEKKELINSYKNFLQNTDNCTLENCGSLLLKDYSLEKTFEEYFSIISNNNVSLVD